MLSQEIRQKFLQYFKSKSHTIVPSSPVIPHDDPTLLFTNAGMNQFKDVFLGQNKREYSRATSSQKCIRAGGKHNDFENVGHTSRHLTFFEMLGNFSFGDYFKKEAIEFAFDVTTNIFKFDIEKLWISIYKDDEEAFELWKKLIPEKRIFRLGDEDNFWAMGDTGPCGPCSELHYDRGKEFANISSPYEDKTGERYIEFWNLVFMQYIKHPDGSMTPLPKKSIDTGAGLERVIALKMGVDNLFLTDILRSLIAEVENISKKKYQENNKQTAPAFQVIADHIRTLAFAIADGAKPSNVERGYILRKILRRAVKYGKRLDLNKPFLSKLLPRLTSLMGDDFPELQIAENHTAEILQTEEENFLRTLKRGGNLFNQIVEKSKGKITGEDAFKLKDTYGFPIDEILVIAKDQHLQVDLQKFDILDQEAKEKSRKAQKTISQSFESNFFEDFSKTHEPNTFLGYDTHSASAKIIAIIINDQFVDTIEEGQEGTIILDQTPFYAEKGGQIADMGIIENSNNSFSVSDSQTPLSGIVLHIGKVIKGNFKKDQSITATINTKRRQLIGNNHTATHLLHWALGKVLKAPLQQAGSLVEDTGFRFDFNYHKALTETQIRDIEKEVNNKIRENLPVNTYTLTFEEAQQRKDIKQIFGEKYESSVRVIDIEFSKELCGGTHTDKLGNIGLFKITKEFSIAAGIRRIEATTGQFSEEFVYEKDDLINNISSLAKTPPQKIKEKIASLLEENKLLSLEIKELKNIQLLNLAKDITKDIEKINSINTIFKIVNLSSQDINTLADKLLSITPSIIICLAKKEENKCNILIKISTDLIEKNIHANEMIKQITPIIKGGGGGKKDQAQAGGTACDQIEEAFQTIKKIIKNKC